MICQSCKEKDIIISRLQKRIDELEKKNDNFKEQLDEVKSYIWKSNVKPKTPNHIGPPVGHTPHNRPISNTIHRKIELSLKCCPDCGGKLSAPVRIRKRVLEDIRPPEQMNTEYVIPHYYCKACKKQVHPEPAEAVPRCKFGLNFMLLVTFMRYGMLLPYNKIVKMLLLVYGMKVSEGCLVDTMTRFAGYLGPEFSGIKKEVKELAKVHMDWTGWRLAGRNVWLWDFIGEKVSLLIIRDGRGKGVIYEALGEDYKGVSISDCMPTADNLPWRQQKCWVHFLRYTRNLDSGQGKLLHARLKQIYDDSKSGNFTPERMRERIGELRSAGFTCSRCLRIIARLEKQMENLFTFMDTPGVSDNNNEAERGLRHSVVMRKITGGSRSERGLKNHEIIMSTMQTWEKRGLDFFEEGARIVEEGLR